MIHININGRKWEWYKANITYDEIVKLASGQLFIDGLPDYSIKFRIGQYVSVLLRGEEVGAVDEMKIDAYVTGAA